jgi:hypothetical protein
MSMLETPVPERWTVVSPQRPSGDIDVPEENDTLTAIPPVPPTEMLGIPVA